MSSDNQKKAIYAAGQDSDEAAETILNYTGPSMNPTLKAGDGMTVVPYGDSKVQVGDVIVFQSPEQDHYVVHRVISVDSHGVRTIGDNNDLIDPWVLRPSDIMGRVVSARRGNKDITIHGGNRGRLRLPILQVTKRFKTGLFRTLHLPYHGLARLGIIRRLFSPLIKTQLLYFERPNGIEIQLLMRNRIIARRLPERTVWQIRRPFRLLVDEKSLPEDVMPGSVTPRSSSETNE